MPRRLLFALLFFGAAMLAQAPAVLWDAIVQRVTRGNAALALATGSLWEGSGELSIIHPASGRYRPLMPIRWSWQPGALWRGQFAWDMSLAASRPFRLALSARGFSVSGANLDIPAHAALERIPNAVGRIGWKGDVRLAVPAWQCSWQRLCEGEASAYWRGAGADIFPGRMLGDYRIRASGQGERIVLNWHTDQGEARITARGELQRSGRFSINGNIAGDPAFMARLPNIAGGLVRPAGSPGSFDFAYQAAPPPRGGGS